MASSTPQSSNGASGSGPGAKKQLIINAFVESCSGHQSPGLWRHPRDRSSEFNNVKHWVELAQLLEKGHFHGMFIADVLVSHAILAAGGGGGGAHGSNCEYQRAPMMCTKAHGTPTRL